MRRNVMELPALSSIYACLTSTTPTLSTNINVGLMHLFIT